MNKIVLLTNSLALIITVNVYAQQLTEIHDTSEVIPWPDDFAFSPEAPQEPLVTLNQYFEAGCALFGVHDSQLNNSQFFCIHRNTKGNIVGQWFFNSLALGADFEGMDYNGKYIFVSSGDDAKSPDWQKGQIWRSEPPSLSNCRFFGLSSPPGNSGVATAKGVAMEEVDGITFFDNGDLFGWAQEAGLFYVPHPVFNSSSNKLSKAVLLFKQPGEVEDIEFLGNKLYGILNIDHLDQAEDGDGEPHAGHVGYPEDVNAAIKPGGVLKANFVEYNLSTDNFTTPCQQEVLDALIKKGFQAAEIEALEVLPRLPGVTENHMLLGFHASNAIIGNGSRSTFVIGVLNLDQCNLELRSIRNIPGPDFKERQLDVEGLTMICPSSSSGSSSGSGRIPG